MSVITLLDRMQKTFNVFRNEGEPMANSMQVHELFRRVQHPQPQDTVKAIEVRDDLDGIKYSYAANHLTYTVYKIPEYQLLHKVSGIQASGGNSGDGGPRRGGHNRGSMYNSQGKVYTGYLPELERPEINRSQDRHLLTQEKG